MIEYVRNGENKLLAVIVRENYTKKDGIEFFTSSDSTQQIGCAGHKKGTVIAAHIHNKVKREVFYTHETLIIKSGKIRADFYNDDQTYVKSVELAKGDIILFTEGGHGFKYLEDTQLVEIKQGPYLEKDDKVRFSGISESEVRLR